MTTSTIIIAVFGAIAVLLVANELRRAFFAPRCPKCGEVKEDYGCPRCFDSDDDGFPD